MLTDAKPCSKCAELKAYVGDGLFRSDYKDAAAMRDRIAELDKIEAAARNVFRVRGRHNSQIAMCRLGELLGERVTWPEKGEKS